MIPMGRGEYWIPRDWTLETSHLPSSELLDWSIEFLGISDAWRDNEGTIGSEPIKVCVLDTGCDLDHPDLDGAIIDASDFTNSYVGAEDRHSHGTWCVGMIAARANSTGVRGIAPQSRVLVAKVLGDNGTGNDRSIGAGLDWGMEQGAQFFSLSLGGPNMSPWLEEKFADLAAAGAYIFAASGNDGGAVNSPGRYPSTVAVGAVNEEGKLTRFTSRGPELDVVAPGVNMISTIPGGKYGKMTGTSMACPCACGVGMLAVGKHRSIGGNTPLDNMNEMREHLRETSIPVRGGYGLINPRDLMELHEKTRHPVVSFGPIKIYQPARPGDLLSIDIS